MKSSRSSTGDDVDVDGSGADGLDETFLPPGARAPQLAHAHAGDVLRIGAIERTSTVSGPGRRAVLWVTGCLRRCPACIKPEFLSFNAGSDHPVEDVLAMLLAIDGLEGVTFSGGEPFEQPRALARLADGLRAAGLSVGSYTGYRLADLRAAGGDKVLLLDAIDFLIDGEYRRELPGPFRWYGSENQTFVELRTGRIVPQPLQREVQVTVEGDTIRLLGFPDRAFEAELARRLALRGITLGGTS